MWSIALPGFGQLLNRRYIKGLTFIFLEFLININANVNTIIFYSFLGDIQAAIDKANYQWLLFYPCVYFFAMWDAYRDASGENKPLIFLPFVFSAYFMTVGVIYSPVLKIFDILPGPVFLPLLSIIPGVLVGHIIKSILERFWRKPSSMA
ncbi:hypothetical protein SAMN05216225_100965 [Ornithinibacillus halophilus]|uniref:Uncharacterized protein n=2 Tax=Ornithinibacillus halophilus TaxID=930117 RepID=A0A1M5FP35_9BACI|nr:hypothetical protein SAMN05216225_100965 [Ornithinibacillus halophilus]